ncbi:MAG TPA: alanine--tRNA ligase [Pseudomonadales bacterium]
MKSADIREAFLRYFEQHGHARVPSSSLVPGNDPTLLFTNAGMVQFKDCFLGREKRAYVRAVSSQRCVRAGGKHNDLENVGYTARHHTFFEMLGNFSFGDYFKHDAIRFAWEFLTSKEWLAIPQEKLWVTVYADDDEAYAIWKDDMGVPAERIVRIGDNKGAKYASDNFWAMGDTGPCGPCTEIFYDHGADVAGGPPGSPDEDGDRYIEIWNNVFMQFNRTEDGVMHPLPKPSVDTGMGLERISAVMQHVHSNYEIDLFTHLLQAAADAVGCENHNQPSLRVIADHIRSCAFLIVDGVLPSNEGRGYVLRRIIRRAIRHGHKLGAEGEFFHQLVVALAAEMGDAYPELKAQQATISKVLRTEEEQFAQTLDQGMRLLEQAIADLKGRELAGETAFRLYDTYGFPVDLTADVARERGLTVDMAGFEACMNAQRERARSASQFGSDYAITVEGKTDFTGYDELDGSAVVLALFRDGQPVEALDENEPGVIVLDSSPFYAESGGQAGDSGLIGNDRVRFEVRDTTKSGDSFLHHGILAQGAIKKGDRLNAAVAVDVRQATALNHSATHLLHAALREVLGAHVVQKGSLVTSERLRFDFAHFEPVSAEQLQAIERLVNEEIRANTPVETDVTDMESARKKGAMALFGEKYGDRVRVLTMGKGFSVELCGGTHAKRTGDIGVMRIVSEAGVAAGVRRIEAVTGVGALHWLDQQAACLHSVEQLVRTSRDQLVSRVEQLITGQKALEKELAALKSKLAAAAGGDLAQQAVSINGVTVLAAALPGADVQTLRTTLDQLRDKLGSAVVVLASAEGGKATLIAGVTADLVARFKAGDLIRELAVQVGGKGGGRPDTAQGGGSQPENIPAALESVAAWVSAR